MTIRKKITKILLKLAEDNEAEHEAEHLLNYRPFRAHAGTTVTDPLQMQRKAC